VEGSWVFFGGGRVGSFALTGDEDTRVKQGVCHSHFGLAIYIKKYLMAKEEL
jgi:hypothetical protein